MLSPELAAPQRPTYSSAQSIAIAKLLTADCSQLVAY